MTSFSVFTTNLILDKFIGKTRLIPLHFAALKHIVMKKIRFGYYIVCIAFFALFFAGCHMAKSKKDTSENTQVDMHSTYDDSTLANNLLPVLMPFNRLIDPAGKVISFGDPALENHSMDAELTPGSPLLAVEDRYGIALIDTQKKVVAARWTYNDDKNYTGLMSTYSGLKILVTDKETQIFWSAAVSRSGGNSKSLVLQAGWDGKKISIKNSFSFKPKSPSPLALPNDLAINDESGVNYLYVVLNGNDELVKINLNDNSIVWTKQTGVAPYGITIAENKIFVSNWAGPQPTDTLNKETAGVPYGKTYIDPKTGATLQGSVSVFEPGSGNMIKEISVGLHPNALINSPDGKFVYVANGNSDYVSVINTDKLQNADVIPVRLIPGKKSFIGDTPNALAINADGTTLYVANGLDNAVAVVKLGSK